LFNHLYPEAHLSVAHLGIILYRNWRVLRAAGQSGGVDLAFVARVFAFGMYIATGMVYVQDRKRIQQ
jgi:hypothetical protein